MFEYRLTLIVLAMGAFFSPLVCQSLMSKGIPWQSFYLGSLALSGVNTIFLVLAYHPTRAEFNDDRLKALRAASSLVPSQVELDLPSEATNPSRRPTKARSRSSESN